MTDIIPLSCSGSWADMWVCSLLHFVWQAAVIGLIHYLGMLFLSNSTAQARYTLGVCSLQLLVCCPLLTFGLLVAKSGDATPTATLVELPGITPEYPGQDEAMRVRSPAIGKPVGLSFTAWRFALLWGWSLGVLVLSTRIWGGALFVCWLRRRVVPLAEPLKSHVEQLRRRLRVSGRIVVAASARVTTAVAFGLIRPMVLLPAAWLTDLPPSMLQAVVAHELAHIRRCDLWVNLLQRVTETLWFYHPAVWCISAAIRRERETCCDELAVSALKSPLQYAETLEFLAASGVAGVAPFWLTAGMGGKRMIILNRVKHILGVETSRASLAPWPAVVVFLLCCLGAFTVNRGNQQASAAQQDAVRTDEVDSPDAEQAAPGNTYVVKLSAVEEADEREDQTAASQESTEDLRNNLELAKQQLRQYQVLIERLQRQVDRALSVRDERHRFPGADVASDSALAGKVDATTVTKSSLAKAGPQAESRGVVGRRRQLEMHLRVLQERQKYLNAEMEQAEKRSEQQRAARREFFETELRHHQEELGIQEKRMHLERRRLELQRERRQREITRGIEETERLRQHTDDPQEQQRLDREMEAMRAELATLEAEYAVESELQALELQADQNHLRSQYHSKLRQMEIDSEMQLQATMDQLRSELQKLELERMQVRMQLQAE